MPDPATDARREKDGRTWRIGGDAELAWIRENTEVSRAITSAIPPVFAAYATLELPGTGEHDQQSWLEDPDRHDAAVLSVLIEHTAAQPWWLGYLDTGASDVIFHDAPKVALFPTHNYVMIEAGPAQAERWRSEWNRVKGTLPDLIFPADRSWLLSTLWDDDWTCVGGSRALIDALRSCSPPTPCTAGRSDRGGHDPAGAHLVLSDRPLSSGEELLRGSESPAGRSTAGSRDPGQRQARGTSYS